MMFNHIVVCILGYCQPTTNSNYSDTMDPSHIDYDFIIYTVCTHIGMFNMSKHSGKSDMD